MTGLAETANKSLQDMICFKDVEAYVLHGFDDYIINGGDVNCVLYRNKEEGYENENLARICSAVLRDDCSDVVKMIIDSGADTDGHGQTILESIICYSSSFSCKHKPIIDLLLKKGLVLNDDECKFYINRSDCNYLIKVCIDGGVSVDFIGNCGYSPLLTAITLGHNKKLNNLLKLFDANPNSLNVELRTPIHYAVDSDPQCIHLLLYHGADLFARDIYNKTCMDGFRDVTENSWGWNHYKPILQEILKHILLFMDENCLDIFFKSLKDNFKQVLFMFNNECKTEINKMQNTLITDDLSFYQLCISKRFYKSKFIDISIDEVLPKYKELKELFPIYQNIIQMRMKDNQIQLHKFRLLSYACLGNINMRPSNVTSVIPDVELIYDCRYLVSRYLNTKEVYNLFLASL